MGGEIHRKAAPVYKPHFSEWSERVASCSPENILHEHLIFQYQKLATNKFATWIFLIKRLFVLLFFFQMCWPPSRLLSNLCRTRQNSGTSRISRGTRVSVPLQLAINEGNEPPNTDIIASLCAAISVLKDREPGCFIVRDSHSFRGAYGLAMKVATPPPSVLQQSKKGTAL